MSKCVFQNLESYSCSIPEPSLCPLDLSGWLGPSVRETNDAFPHLNKTTQKFPYVLKRPVFSHLTTLLAVSIALSTGFCEHNTIWPLVTLHPLALTRAWCHCGNLRGNAISVGEYTGPSFSSFESCTLWVWGEKMKLCLKVNCIDRKRLSSEICEEFEPLNHSNLRLAPDSTRSCLRFEVITQSSKMPHHCEADLQFYTKVPTIIMALTNFNPSSVIC